MNGALLRTGLKRTAALILALAALMAGSAPIGCGCGADDGAGKENYKMG